MNDHDTTPEDSRALAFRSLITSLEVADEAVCKLCNAMGAEMSETLEDNDPGDVIFAVVSAELKHRIDGLHDLLENTDKLFELFVRHKDADGPLEAALALLAITAQLDLIDITFDKDIKLSAGLRPKE